jgi:hypothetical protein
MTFEQFFIEQFLNRKVTQVGYNGRHHKGYSRTLKQLKREEAEARNALTVPERRRAYRRLPLDQRTGLTPGKQA